MDELEIGKQLLRKICDDFALQEDVMQGVEGEYKHALAVLKWAEKLYDGPLPASLALSAIFHDIDRIVTPKVGGGFSGDRKSEEYLQHKKQHAHRSAEYARKILNNRKMDPSLIQRVQFLIEHHDDNQQNTITSDDKELQALIAADTFAFFTTIAPTLYKVEGEKRLKDKIIFMLGKLNDETRVKLWETPLAETLFEQIKNDCLKDYFLANNPRGKEYTYCPSCAHRLINKQIDNRTLRSCPKCPFVFWNNPKPVASMLIARDKKILMVQRAQAPLLGHWCLPGGYVSYGEQPQDTAIRETKEETSLDTEAGHLVGVYSIDNDPRGFNIDIIYSGSIVTGTIAPNDEVRCCKYFHVDDLPKQIAYRHREAIKDWLSEQN
ncbi:NUDIX domain-containing protein [Candidatus Saccharibacteria bacterium]|nr:NUDIX domain-containing protein [Candidatus Saccharibacteria bacterium]